MLVSRWGRRSACVQSRYSVWSNASFSTVSDDEQHLSWRSRIKNTAINPQLLEFLDMQRLGKLTTRRTRKQAASNYRSLESGMRKGSRLSDNLKVFREFPFNRPAKSLGEIKNWTPQTTSTLPPGILQMPQIAVVGRSNVGKSTLLNWLAGFNNSYVQKAPMSDKPGETKALSFFHLGKFQAPTAAGDAKTALRNGIVLVDMPGYGFAFMNEEETLRCNTLMKDYLLAPLKDTSIRLKRVLLLLDSRHGIKQADLDFLQDLHKTYLDLSLADRQNLKWKLQIVLTKCDLVERQSLCRLLTLLRQDVIDRFPGRFVPDLPILPISTQDEKGMENLLKSLYSLALVERLPTPNVGVPKPRAQKVETVTSMSSHRSGANATGTVDRTAPKSRSFSPTSPFKGNQHRNKSPKLSKEDSYSPRPNKLDRKSEPAKIKKPRWPKPARGDDDRHNNNDDDELSMTPIDYDPSPAPTRRPAFRRFVPKRAAH